MIEYSAKMNNKLRYALVIVFGLLTIEMVWIGARSHKVLFYVAAAACVGAITRVTWIKSQS